MVEAAPLAAPSEASCSSRSARVMAAVELSVATWEPACISLIERLNEPVAASLASLISRAMVSLLSIMVRVKVKPLASIAFTA